VGAPRGAGHAGGERLHADPRRRLADLLGRSHPRARHGEPNACASASACSRIATRSRWRGSCPSTSTFASRSTAVGRGGMEPELIAEAGRLLAALERGVLDRAVDWAVAPPEGGADARYALGAALSLRCLEEPLLAPLAEALTRPQPPARPDPAAARRLLLERRWKNPFVIACGRLPQRGPWPERSQQIADALERLGRAAGEIAPIVARLLLASAEAPASPSHVRGQAPGHVAPSQAPEAPAPPRVPVMLINQVAAPARSKHYLALCAIFTNEARLPAGVDRVPPDRRRRPLLTSTRTRATTTSPPPSSRTSRAAS